MTVQVAQFKNEAIQCCNHNPSYVPRNSWGQGDSIMNQYNFYGNSLPPVMFPPKPHKKNMIEEFIERFRNLREKSMMKQYEQSKNIFNKDKYTIYY